MQKIAPFLWFDGKAEKAMKFYTSIFKNSKVRDVMRYGDAGPGPKGSVMSCTSSLKGKSSWRSTADRCSRSRRPFRSS
jgi:predicted 3-demethylubiquinone-9 3-methyltransferase (glyoxalase superfamily)